ncbi:MAG: hypothetical protein JWL70_2314 [Acidimicrobiia bacterium]|nr:hypothetical protein [Acidimicrobiia bacterium]
MGQPVAVTGDQITGVCMGHQIPSPVGAPMPAPPLPFAAPVVQQVAPTVLVGGKPVVVAGSWGLCSPPQVGLHASDPFQAPLQRGAVVVGSPTVLAEGKPVATAAATCTICFGLPGTLVATGVTVLVG